LTSKIATFDKGNEIIESTNAYLGDAVTEGLARVTLYFSLFKVLETREPSGDFWFTKIEKTLNNQWPNMDWDSI